MDYSAFVSQAVLFFTGTLPTTEVCNELSFPPRSRKFLVWDEFVCGNSLQGRTTPDKVIELADLFQRVYTQGALDLPLAEGMRQAEEHFTKADPRNTAKDKGSKYHKEMSGTTDVVIKVDTYDQLVANTIICPATAHAIKKINDAGARGTKSWEQDIDEAINSLVRAKQLRPAMLKAIQRLIDKGIPND